MTTDDALLVLRDLKKLLSDGSDFTESKSFQSLVSLEAALSQLDLDSSDNDSYTLRRAQSLQQVSMRLQDALRDSLGGSYSSRAATLLVVSECYLKLAHAFKVDSDTWSKAQSELVPVLTAAVDETSLDDAVNSLMSHLTSYVNALSEWITKEG